jgi:diguanylate cyclase (GGDEF)-like protein
MAMTAGRIRFARPSAWSLVAQRPRVIGYVLAVDVAAVALVPISLWLTPIPRSDYGYFAILIACCVGYGEASRRIERLRRQSSSTPHIDLNSVWMFACVLLLHPALTAALIVTFHTHRWMRVAHRIVHRVTFSAAAAICSAGAATLFLVALGRYHTFATGHRDAAMFAVVAGAAAVFIAVNSVLVSTAVALSIPNPSLRTVTADPSDYGLEAATLALGALLGWSLADWPWMIVPIVGITLVLHGKVLIRQLKEAATTDAKTGLLNTEAWYAAARREISRAERHEATVGVLIIDLDHFKRVNDDHGHLAGDEVLIAVAEAITGQVRGYDVIGRFGGEEFLALLPDIDSQHLVAVAERIRREIAGLVLPVTGHRGTVLFRGLTASVGIAVYPQHGAELDDVLRAADSALFSAKAAGRNQIQLAAAAPRSIIRTERPRGPQARKPLPEGLDELAP